LTIIGVADKLLAQWLYPKMHSVTKQFKQYIIKFKIL